MDPRHREEVEKGRALGVLVNSVGWDVLLEYVDGLITARKHLVFSPVDQIGGTYAAEYLKGEIAGLELLRVLPQRVMGEAEDLTKLFENQEESEMENGSAGSDD